METALIFKKLGFDGNIRITPDGKASVLDIIKVAGGQKTADKTWERIKDQDQVLSDCLHFRFKGQGARDTPVISAEGLDILINLIPGEAAKKFRIKGCETLRRIMAGDKTLIKEIETNHDIAQRDSGSAQAFFKRTLSKTDQKDLKSYDKTNYIYVRGLAESLFLKANLPVTEDEKKPRLNFDLVKFGITQSLDKRNDNYGDDNGFYHYAICLPKAADAAHVEAIIRARFKKLVIGYKHEYIDSKGLYAYFNRSENDLLEELDHVKYKQLLRALYAHIVTETHNMYPYTKEMNEPFGWMYCETEDISTIDETSEIACISSEITPVKMSEEKLPEYGDIYPGHNLLITQNSQLLMEMEKTKQAQEDRLKVEAQEDRLKVEAQEDRLKVEAQEERLKIEAQEETKRAQEERLKVEAQEKTKQLTLQLEILKLQQSQKEISATAATPAPSNSIPPIRVLIPAQRVVPESDIKILRQHVKSFVTECCILRAGVREHTVNLRTSFEKYRRAHNHSGGWIELQKHMVALGCTKNKSSFADARNPLKKKTKGWIGIQLTPEIFSQC